MAHIYGTEGRISIERVHCPEKLTVTRSGSGEVQVPEPYPRIGLGVEAPSAPQIPLIAVEEPFKETGARISRAEAYFLTVKMVT